MRVTPVPLCLAFLVLSSVALSLPAAAQPTVMVEQGLGSQTYFPEGTLASMYPQLTESEAFLARLQSGFVLDQPFPRKLEALQEVRAIILNDIPASALNGFMGRLTLRRYVEQGGRLLMFGGPLSFGKGDITGSFLEDLLPVTVTGPWDLVKATNSEVQPGRASPVTQGLTWEDRPRIYYYHKVLPKPGAEVLLTCEGQPLLVTGRYGQGRVAVFLGAFMTGEPPANETFLYQWTGYRLLLGRVLRWLFEKGP